MVTENALRGCSFFSSTPETAFAPEDFIADELLMIQMAEKFSREEILPQVEAIDQQEPGLMPALIAKAGELGFCGIDTPEAYGGLGLSKNLAARILEFLSLNGSFSVTIGITSGISQVGVSLFGNEAQKKKYLPLLTSGEQIGAYCLSEPNSGSDALSMSSRAEQKDGKWVINGTKMWISNAQWATQFIVLAKVEDKVTAFIVERDFPGVSIAREEHKMGLKGSSTARVVLENAEVPLENVIWEPGKGHYIAFNALNLGRFKLASMSIGPAREALRCAAAYASDRKQFGKSLVEFELIQKKLAESAARFFAAESMIYRTGALIDTAFDYCKTLDLPEIDANRKAAEEYAIECSACKVFATEAEGFIVDEAIQTYGGYGFTEEFPVARLYRDARVSRIYEGTNEINRIFLADRFLKRVKEGKASVVASGDSFVSELAGAAFAKVGDAPGQAKVGALSDLLMLSYAEQSARLRAARFPRYGAVYDLFLNWANVQAGQAYQQVTGEGVTIPAPRSANLGEIAQAVVRAKGPLD
ncbi:MAG: acyl-CoA dehydrogenase family protein [Armatimonadetes bacterium]|nr:acyl-CoA dehydrogenase family protein [Armatimonadota bacterium]